MKFYHGTSQKSWEEIQKDGELYGYDRIWSNDRKTILHEHRVTYLATEREEAACYGDVVLEVEYDPYRSDAQCNHFEDGCWQIRVYEPISLSHIKRIQ